MARSARARSTTQAAISATASAARYPVPGPAGGRLIRQVIALLKDHRVSLPISSHILIATSGGSDSVALAHLLIRYGRRIARAGQISLVHVNHGWRGEESDGDARFVQALAERWGVSCITRTLAPPARASRETRSPGASLEELARDARKRVYGELARSKKALVLTAHHADDLAETVLWRLLTGSADTHGGGIAVRHGHELRPLLGTRKSLLQEFLKEEGIAWREDRTNHEGRFLRSRMRGELMPALEGLFPRGVEHLARQALDAQKRGPKPAAKASPLDEPLALLGAAGLKARRAHLDALTERLAASPAWVGEMHLPEGWKLRRERSAGGCRWVLERG